MSSGQNQDLILFKDNSLVSEQILNSKASLLSLITHVQGTSPAWLTNSLIENALCGTAALVNNDLTKKVDNRAEVILISFLHSKDHYIKNCRKNGLDLATNPSFTFVDCFTKLFTETIKTPEKASSEVANLFGNIISTISKIENSRKVVFVEAPEILLQATSVSSDELLALLLKINRLSRQLFVISSRDYNTVFNLDSSVSQDPVFKCTDFLVKLHHRSQYNISLQPLSTGRANDITGSLAVSTGAIPVDSLIPNLYVNEKEYIFNITKDSNVRLFLR
ncbi:hypothetical protein G9P44_003644 [Scheffersomyces stipitis]|nr:hypothetical protein G9P44_003644 [Scheffersomyces stipitis]